MQHTNIYLAYLDFGIAETRMHSSRTASVVTTRCQYQKRVWLQRGGLLTENGCDYRQRVCLHRMILPIEKGSSLHRAAPLMNRQTPLKALSSIAVGNKLYILEGINSSPTHVYYLFIQNLVFVSNKWGCLNWH